jgi:hypothetical protein
MTRDEALARLSTPAYDPETIHQDVEYVATKLGISVDELNGYLRAPNKSFRDYRSQMWIYDVGAKAAKALGLEVGGKR